jgi:hypothetical protein
MSIIYPLKKLKPKKFKRAMDSKKESHFMLPKACGHQIMNTGKWLGVNSHSAQCF